MAVWCGDWSTYRVFSYTKWTTAGYNSISIALLLNALSYIYGKLSCKVGGIYEDNGLHKLRRRRRRCTYFYGTDMAAAAAATALARTQIDLIIV